MDLELTTVLLFLSVFVNLVFTMDRSKDAFNLKDIHTIERPPDDGPTLVYIEIFVNNLGPVVEDLMSYKIDIFLRQRWRDIRFNNNGTSDGKLVRLPYLFTSKVWGPDTYFMNSIDAKHHDVTTLNGMVTVSDDGNVTHSIRVTVEATCHMELTYFPMDIQYCPFEIESYNWDASELQFIPYTKNGHNKAVEIREDIRLPHFTLSKDIQVSTKNVSYFSMTFSRLTLTFVLQRNMSFYLVDTFCPALMVVILSWVQFFLHRSSVSARASLSVTSVLTMITLIVAANSKMARLSKVKAIDVFFTMCFTYVFAGLLEFGLVCYYDKPRFALNNKSNMKEEENASTKLISHRNTELSVKLIKFIHTLDVYARWGFPLSFVLVNAVFWSYYMLDENSSIYIFNRD